MHNGINMVISDSMRRQEPAFWSGFFRAGPLWVLFQDFIMMIFVTLKCGCALAPHEPLSCGWD
jgi:hypothetical protein